MKKYIVHFLVGALILTIILTGAFAITIRKQRNEISYLHQQLNQANENSAKNSNKFAKLARKHEVMRKAIAALPEECKKIFDDLLGKFLKEVGLESGQAPEIIPLPKENK